MDGAGRRSEPSAEAVAVGRGAGAPTSREEPNVRAGVTSVSLGGVWRLKSRQGELPPGHGGNPRRARGSATHGRRRAPTDTRKAATGWSGWSIAATSRRR